MWLNLYEVETESYNLIESIRDNYYLVALIDNDYVASNDTEESSLWRAMLDVAKEHKELTTSFGPTIVFDEDPV